MAILKFTLGQAAVADDDAIWNSDQIVILKFHDRSCVPVIVLDLES